MTPKNNVVRLRLTDLEREAWALAAGGKGKLSEWIRATCNKAALGSAGGGEAGARDDAVAVPQSAGPSIAKRTRARTGKTPPPTARVEAVSSDWCPRWMHHRPGTYCGSCKRVN